MNSRIMDCSTSSSSPTRFYSMAANSGYSDHPMISPSSPTTPTNPMAGSNVETWSKVLYTKQGVPDNYVPKSFLKDLKKNVNLEKYQLLDIILATRALTQQIISIAFLILMFIHFETSSSSSTLVATLFSLITFVTLFLYLTTILISPKNSVSNEIKSSVIFLVTGFGMSPILRTLTETISTDTIYTMVTLNMLIHLSFNNYGINAAIVSKPISLNAAIFASVCLASRLATTYHAFAFLIFAIDIFVLSEILYNKLSRNMQSILTVVFSIICLLVIYATFSFVYSFLFVVMLLFINILCPIGFYKMQVYKENINGPWDEAIIDRVNCIYPDDDITDSSSSSENASSTPPSTPTRNKKLSSKKF